MKRPNYEALGVSATKPDVHSAIADQDPGLFPGAFCKIVGDTLTEDPDYCLVMHADGAGTKSTVAYIHHKETGDPTVFRDIAQDSLAMNTDDLLCVGATDRLLVSNTIGRNAHRFGAVVLRHLIGGYSDFKDTMSSYDIDIVLAGGETADVGDLVGTVIADSTVTARLEREKVIDCSNIRPGNVIVGLASFGQSEYETRLNSGIGSNGFTLARHALLLCGYAQKYPETYSSTLEKEQVYTGRYELGDNLPNSTQTVGEALLSPTRTYLPVAKEILANFGDFVTGIIHSSGGGQAKCKNFGNDLHYIKDNLFPPPPIFAAIQETGDIPQEEMYRTFNMGQRLEIYCDPAVAEDIISTSQRYGVEARVIGRVENNPGAGNRVTIVDSSGIYEY